MNEVYINARVIKFIRVNNIIDPQVEQNTHRISCTQIKKLITQIDSMHILLKEINKQITVQYVRFNYRFVQRYIDRQVSS